jgi:glutathione S-transferase
VLNPARETPVLELDDGTILTQSNAILWFLGQGTRFLPESPLERAQVAQWLFFEQERVMTGIGGARFRIVTGRNPELVPARLELGESALTMLEAHLQGRSFLVGDSARSRTSRISATRTSLKTLAISLRTSPAWAPGSSA